MQIGNNNHGHARFLLRYYIPGIAALILLVTFTIFQISRSALIGEAEAHALAVAEKINAALHPPHPAGSEALSRPVESDAASQAQINRLLTRYADGMPVTKIMLIDRKLRHILSTDRIVRFPEPDQFPPALGRAFAGSTHHRLVRLAGGEDSASATVLESYVPIRLRSDQPHAPVETVIYLVQSTERLMARIAILRRTVVVIAALSFLAFIAYLKFVLTNADRVQTNLRREIENYAENLETMVDERTRQLREEKNKLQVILNHVPSAFVLVDRNFQIQATSAALQEIIGEHLTDVTGKHCYDVICKRQMRGRCPTQKALQKNAIASSTFIFKQNGTDRYLEHLAVPISNGGKIDSILEIITDVTERKKMQDYLIQAEKLSAVGQISATIAHEIRNGLTSVKLILQHLAASMPRASTTSKATHVALESIGDMEKVVKQLLDFARPSPITFKTTDINKLIRYCVNFCKRQVEVRKLLLVEEYNPDMPLLRLDAEHMREAVINLILNATQASKENQKLRIRTGVYTLEADLSAYFFEKKRTVRLTRDQQVAQIEIADCGCGIPAENFEKIFEPFYTTKLDGSGLGLPVTRRTVLEHGGIITVRSTPGRGSTFTINLPI